MPFVWLGAHCYPARIHQVGAGSTLEEVQPLVHSRYTCLPRLPGLGRLAVPTHPVVVRAACRPPSHLRGQAALSFVRPAATGRRRVLSSRPVHGASWRTRRSWSRMTRTWARRAIRSKVWETACGCIGSPLPSVKIQSAELMPAACWSVRCQVRHAVRTPTVVGSRSMRRRALAVFPRVSCSS